MNKKYLLLALLSFASFAKDNSLGNTTEVINDVANALKKTTVDPEVKKSADHTIEMAKDKDCSPESESSLKSKSPQNTSEEISKKPSLFFNIQLMVSGKNGQPSFKEVRIPVINIRNEMRLHARAKHLTREQVIAMKDDEVRKVFMDNQAGLNNNQPLEGQAKLDAVENSLLLKKLASMGDETLMYKTLEKEMSKASFGKKINFLANFLAHLEDNYEDSATNGGTGRNATDAEMMAALNESFITGKEVPAGVCRHMHQLAVRYAQAMGIKEAFGVAFNARGIAHHTLILTSPNDPTKVIQLNYGEKSEMKGISGPGALSQNGSIPSTGIAFRIIDAKDNHVINLPSELGAVLNTVTGGVDADLSPNFKSNAQIQQVGVNTPYGTVRFFGAQNPTENKTEVVGAAYNIKLNYNDVFYGKYGFAGFTSERPVEKGSMKNKGVYAQIAQGFDWKFYESKDINLSTFGELHLRATTYCTSMEEGKCKFNGDGQVDLTAGLMARYKTGPLTNTTSLIFQTIPHLNSNMEMQIPNVPVSKLSHDVNFKIYKEVYGNVGGSVTMYSLGNGTYWTYNGHTGVSSPKTGTYAGVSSDGRITNDTPFWLPDSERQVSAIIKQSIFGEKLFVGVDGKQSVDVGENHYIGLTLGGKF